MNKINFINSNSQKNESTYLSWIKFCKISLIIFFTVVSILQINQLINFINLKKQKNGLEAILINFDQTVQEKNKIKDYKIQVEKQLKTIEKRSSSHQAALAYNLLSEIINALPQDIYVESLDYSSKNGLTIKGCCAILQEAINFVKNLNTIHFIYDAKLEYVKFKEGIKLDALQAENQFLHEFLITLKLKK